MEKNLSGCQHYMQLKLSHVKEYCQNWSTQKARVKRTNSEAVRFLFCELVSYLWISLLRFHLKTKGAQKPKNRLQETNQLIGKLQQIVVVSAVVGYLLQLILCGCPAALPHRIWPGNYVVCLGFFNNNFQYPLKWLKYSSLYIGKLCDTFYCIPKVGTCKENSPWVVSPAISLYACCPK